MDNRTKDTPNTTKPTEPPVLEGQIGLEEWLKTRASADAPIEKDTKSTQESRKEGSDPFSGDGWEDDDWVPADPEEPEDAKDLHVVPEEKPESASLQEAIAKYSSALTDSQREEAIRDMKYFAGNGDVKACLLLARNYSPYAPNGFPRKEEASSLQWFLKAASLGSARGANEAAFLLYRGSDAIRNPALALQYAEQAVKLDPENETYLRNRDAIREEVQNSKNANLEAMPEETPPVIPIPGSAPAAAAPAPETYARKPRAKRKFSLNLFRKKSVKKDTKETESKEPETDSSATEESEKSPAPEASADLDRGGEEFHPGELSGNPAEDTEATLLSTEEAKEEESQNPEPEPLPTLEEAVDRYNHSTSASVRQDAVLVIEKIAQQGDVRACLLLANSYLPKSANGFQHRSEKTALHWYQRASALGSGKGANEAASLLFAGSPEVRDPAAAYPYSLRSIQLNPENEVYQKNFEFIRTRLLQQDIRPKTLEEAEAEVSEENVSETLTAWNRKPPAKTKRTEHSYRPPQVRNEKLLAESEEGRLLVFDICSGTALVVLAILFYVRDMLSFLIPLAVLLALLIWVNLQMSGCHLCLYENYITGRCSYGRDVCIPIRSITSIGTNAMGAVRIASPNSVSSFYLLKNTEDFLALLNKHVTKVQNTDS